MIVRYLVIFCALIFSLNVIAQVETNTDEAASVQSLTPEPTMAEQLHMMQHASPLPNLMRVALNNTEAIKLDEKQVRNLEFWRDRQSIVARRLVKEIMALEAEIKEASLSGKSTGYLINKISTMLSKRMQLASQKVLCRDNMMHVLTPEQWSKVVELYRQ